MPSRRRSPRLDTVRIAVAGATGFTGRLVARALAGRGAALVLVGRDAGRLARAAERVAGAETRTVPHWTEAALAEALAGCDAVVSCAGPFVTAGWPVVRAAVGARVPYCDSTGEQAFLRGVFDTLDSPARAAGIPLVPAAGFDFVPGDLGCAIAAEGAGPLSSLEVTYASESGATSAGTRRTMIEILAAPAVERVAGELRTIRIGAHRKRVDTPFGPITALSFPGGESITAPRHVDVRSVRSYIGARRARRGLALLLPVLRRLVKLRPVRAMLQRRFAASGPEGPNDRSRDRRFICRIDAVAADGGGRSVLLEGRDPYGFTAAALAELALRMAVGRVRGTGALAPAEAVEPRPFLRDLGVAIGG